MKRAYKRITAILLAALMLATTVPEQALAQEADPAVVQEMQQEETPVEETEENGQEEPAEDEEAAPAEEEQEPEETPDTEDEKTESEENSNEQDDEKLPAQEETLSSNELTESVEETADTVSAQAEVTEEIYINPIYKDIITEEDILALQSDEPQDDRYTAQSDVTYTTLEDAGKYLADQMVQRKETITVNVTGGAFSWREVLKAAEETYDDSTGITGDAIRYQYGGCSGYSGYGYYTYTNIRYYTSAAQETELTEKVSEIVAELNLGAADDYTKVKAIHDYLVGHITYGKSSSTSESPYIPYTAYGALISNVCVCQGFSVAFYRLCSEVGVSSRVISGTTINHAWNIAGVDDLYYNVDCTWDNSSYEISYTFFLKSDSDFRDHPRDTEYTSAAFYARYPMALASYGKEAGEGLQDPDKLNGDNSALNYSFTTVDDGTATTQAENGRSKVLVFFRTTCMNCQQVISSIGAMDLTGTDVVAVEAYNATQSDVKSFRDSYGRDNKQITYTYDTTNTSGNIMWKYLNATGYSISTISFPCMVYIDANNKVQRITTGIQTSEEIRDSLERYCNSTTNYLTYNVIYRANGGTGTDYTETWTTEKPYTVLGNDTVGFSNRSLGFRLWNTKANGKGTSYSAGDQISVPVSRPLVLYAVWASNPATSVQIQPEAHTIMAKEQMTIKMTCTAQEEGETSDEQIWSSSNPKVASVDATGKVTGVGEGTATIKLQLGSVSDSCEIKVLKNMELTQSELQLTKGEVQQISVKEISNLPERKAVVWTTSDEAVATVTGSDTKATIQAVGGGTAVITASYGGYQAVCSVSVQEKLDMPTAVITDAEGNPTAADAFAKNSQVTLKSGTAGVTIFYTLDGTEPTEKSLRFDKPLTLAKDTEVRAIAVRKDGYHQNSDTAVFFFKISRHKVVFRSDNDTVAELTLIDGDYLESTDIPQPEKEDYRFEGWFTDPEDEGTRLDLTIPVTGDMTYTARWKKGDQLRITANYADGKQLPDQSAIVLTVSAYDEAGELTQAQVNGVEIYYTLDGSVPTGSSSRYEGPIRLSGLEDEDCNITLYALAKGTGYTGSDPFIRTYTILSRKNGKSVYGEIDPDDIPDEKIEVGKLWIAGLQDSYVYTGLAIKPQIRVYDGTKKLTEKKDYVVSYKNNTNAAAENAVKAPTLVVTGKGNYTGTIARIFSISAKDLGDADIAAEDIYIVSNGKAQKKQPVVKWGKKTLKIKKDYTVDFGDAEYKEAGKYEITITGCGNYTGTRTVTETIADKKSEYLMSKLKVSFANKADQTAVYTGAEICPALLIKNGSRTLEEGTDYEVSYADNIEIGTATVSVKGLHEYKGTRKLTFKITGVSMTKVKVEPGSFVSQVTYEPGKTEYTLPAYDASSQKGYRLSYTYQSKGADGKKQSVTDILEEGRDFAVSYSGNDKAGKATILFTGKGKYTGVLKKNFTIAKNAIFADAEALSIAYDPAVVYCKSGAKPLVTVKAGDVTLTQGVDYTVKYTANTKVYEDSSFKQKNPPTITITGKGNYTGAKRTVHYTISARDLTGVTDIVMTAEDKVYNPKKPKDCSTKVVITDGDGKVLKAGTDYERKLKYFVDDTEVSGDTEFHVGDTVKVATSGRGNYTGEISASFRIVPTALGKATIVIKDQVYTGSEISLSAQDFRTARIGNAKTGTNLVYGEDYVIVAGSYRNGIWKGTASVTLQGIGKYGGTKVVKFKIKAKPVG